MWAYLLSSFVMFQGEHTDYNMGLVFPMALPLVTLVVGDKSESGDVCSVYSESQVTSTNISRHLIIFKTFQNSLVTFSTSDMEQPEQVKMKDEHISIDEGIAIKDQIPYINGK